jgi:predicted dehydrogenase
MLNFALIGLGAWGKNYISTVSQSKDCRIKYICALSQETLQKYGNEYIKVRNYNDLFKFPDIDGVIIATPNDTHYEITQAFLKKNYPVLVEKPFIEDYNLAIKLRSLLAKNKTKLIVGHTYLFDPAYIKAKTIVKTLGQVRYIAYEGTNMGPYRIGTSTLWDIGPHAISLCLDIYAKKPKALSAWAVDSLRPGKKQYDFLYLKLVFENNIEAFIKISWLFPLKKRELVIVGEKDAVMYDAVSDKKVVYFKNMIPKNLQNKNTSTLSYPSYSSSSPLQMEIKEFVDVIENKSNNIYSNFDFGIEVVKILTLAENSIQQKGKLLMVEK